MTEQIVVATITEPQSGEAMTKQIVVATIAEPQSGEARVAGVGPRDN